MKLLLAVLITVPALAVAGLYLWWIERFYNPSKYRKYKGMDPDKIDRPR